MSFFFFSSLGRWFEEKGERGKWRGRMDIVSLLNKPGALATSDWKDGSCGVGRFVVFLGGMLYQVVCTQSRYGGT